MEEKRHTQRSELHSRLMIKRLDQPEIGEEVDITITDVSMGGVGFTCNKTLEIGAIYESFLEIWTKEVLHTFLEIVRIEKKDDTFFYGSLFVGLPEMDAQRIGIYQTVNGMNQK
jgi:hypothetical protein